MSHVDPANLKRRVGGIGVKLEETARGRGIAGSGRSVIYLDLIPNCQVPRSVDAEAPAALDSLFGQRLLADAFFIQGIKSNRTGELKAKRDVNGCGPNQRRRASPAVFYRGQVRIPFHICILMLGPY